MSAGETVARLELTEDRRMALMMILDDWIAENQERPSIDVELAELLDDGRAILGDLQRSVAEG